MLVLLVVEMAEIAVEAVYCLLWRGETCRLRRRCRGRPAASESIVKTVKVKMKLLRKEEPQKPQKYTE